MRLILVVQTLAGYRVWIVTPGDQLGQSGQATVGVLGKHVGVGYIRRNTPYALNKAPLWICTLKTK